MLCGGWGRGRVERVEWDGPIGMLKVLWCFGDPRVRSTERY